MSDDPLDIPQFLRISQEERAARWPWKLERRGYGVVVQPAVPKLEAEGIPPATQETEVKKPAKSTRLAAIRKKAGDRLDKAQARAAAPKKVKVKVDVVAKIAAMMARKNGASMDEMVAATGIQPHPMRSKIKLVRDRLGYETVAPGKANDYRYHATKSASAKSEA